MAQMALIAFRFPSLVVDGTQAPEGILFPAQIGKSKSCGTPGPTDAHGHARTARSTRRAPRRGRSFVTVCFFEVIAAMRW